MIRVSPAVRLSMGLVFIVISILLLINFIGLVPDQSLMAIEARKSRAESMAVQCTYAAKDNDMLALRKTMDSLVETNPEVLSMGLRTTHGKYLFQTEDHKAQWSTPPGEDSTYTNWQVPIYRGNQRWGTLEIAFTPQKGYAVLGIRLSPFALLLLSFAALSFPGFIIFMKRSLRYLDPSSVMPNRVKYALDTLTEGVLLLDTRGRIVLANAMFLEKVGCTAQQLMGTRASGLGWIDPDSNEPAVDMPWAQSLSRAEKQAGIPLTLNTRRDGMRTFVVNSAPVLDDRGRSRGAVVTFDDITEMEKQSFQLSRMVELLQMSRDKITKKNKELEILATQDPLTGCLNRRAFFPRAEQQMASVSAQERKGNHACVMTDIDLFKGINDRYGHAVGDKVIQYFAQSIKSVLREDDLICRYGGEEFCILLPNCSMEEAAIIAERVRDKIETHCSQAIPEAPGIHLSASFGISDLTIGAHTIEELFAQADRALYKAKEGGRNRFVCWDRNMERDFAHKAGTGL
ncbi:MAG: sensor domain-containing diguanylate cyclase [Nitrospiraceae bacterium]|nr:MAG: sensor domain-containing diguanylate cyclase [Nitrospiraceae bacterium]